MTLLISLTYFRFYMTVNKTDCEFNIFLIKLSNSDKLGSAADSIFSMIITGSSFIL